MVLDAQLVKGRGVVAEVLVKWGRIKIGDAVVVGSSFGKVRVSVIRLRIYVTCLLNYLLIS